MRSRLCALAKGVALVVSFVLALGCASGPTEHAARTSTQSVSGGPAREADLAGIEREVRPRVTRYRRSEGLPALASDPRVAEIARGHSREMAAGQMGFGHGGFKGRTHAVAVRVPYRRVAENVSRHQRDPQQIP